MKWPLMKTRFEKKQEPEHEAVSERLDEVEEEMKRMSHRILLLEVEWGLYGDEFHTHNKPGKE
jgi:hypothetical protein